MTERANKYGFTLDDEFKNLLPRLNPKDYRELEKSIRKDGCRDPLVVWDQENILIDGYNRYEICDKHNGRFDIVRLPFKSREEAMFWMISNQISRRNMNKFQWAEVALKFKDTIAEEAKKNQRAGGGTVRQKSAQPFRTREKLAKLAGISHHTIERVKYILFKAANPLNKKIQKQVEALRRSEPGFSINNVYQDLQENKDQKKTLKPAKPKAKGKLPPDLAKHFAMYLLTIDKDLVREFPKIGDRLNFYKALEKWANYKRNNPSPPKK